MPKENRPRGPPCICRSMKIQKPMNSSHGRKEMSTEYHWKGFSSKVKSTPASSHSRFVSESMGPSLTTNRPPSVRIPRNSSSPMILALMICRSLRYSRYWT